MDLGFRQIEREILKVGGLERDIERVWIVIGGGKTQIKRGEGYMAMHLGFGEVRVIKL